MSTSRFSWVGIIAFLSLLFVALGRSLTYPLTDNEGAFLLFGREMTHGARLYADLWDHKPPFYFGLSWLLQMVLPWNDVVLHLFGVAIHVLNGFLLWRLARRMGFSVNAAWASALAYAGLLVSPLVLPWTVDSDLLCLPFLLLSFELLLSDFVEAPLLSGFAFGAAFLTKQSVLLLFPVLLLALWGQWVKARRWFIGAGGLVALTALYFLMTNRWDDFCDALIRFNSIYVAAGWRFFGAVEPFRHFLGQLGWVALEVYGIPLIIFFHGVAGSRAQGVPGRHLLFLSLWVLSAFAAGCASGYFFTYYFVALLPPLALGAGLAWQKWEEQRRKDIALLGLFFGVGVLLFATNLGGTFDHVFAYSQYPTQRYSEDKGAGLLLAVHAQPGDQLLAWGDDPQVYVYSGLKPLVKTPFINHLAYMPDLAAQTLLEFEHKRPRFVVVTLSKQVLPLPAAIRSTLKSHYTKVKSTAELELYVRRDTPGLK